MTANPLFGKNDVQAYQWAEKERAAVGVSADS
jgi:hypothetical protein